MSGGKRGDYVEVHRVYLEAGERDERLPEDSRQVPFEGWVKGFLESDAPLGEKATIRTAAGRTVTGTLARIYPAYEHTFGPPHPALLAIGPLLKSIVRGS